MFQSTLSFVRAFSAATICIIALAATKPAFAIDGRTAVGMCIDSTADGSRCAWSVNDKGEIDICNKSGCVYCASADSECVVAAKRQPHPITTLPAGSTVVTELGTFKVQPHAFTGSFLKVPPSETKAADKVDHKP